MLERIEEYRERCYTKDISPPLSAHIHESLFFKKILANREQYELTDIGVVVNPHGALSPKIKHKDLNGAAFQETLQAIEELSGSEIEIGSNYCK